MSHRIPLGSFYLTSVSAMALTGAAFSGQPVNGPQQSALTGAASSVSPANGPQLPVPCLGPACSSYNKSTGTSTPVAGFVTFGQATATQSGNTLTVTQGTSQAILNWASFNIGANGKVVFQQPAATSIALNKIYQASPSSIFGELTANGQIYLINPNGFVFGPTASVNVAGLIASSLGLYNGDAELTAGILAPTLGNLLPALADAADSAANVVLEPSVNPQSVQVVVQPGAQLTAADGGRLLLAGQNVINGGSLSAPDGQIVLAAGQSVYLAASADPALRGLIVEVTGNGTAANQSGAQLSAPRGNVSLIGLAVNQDGRISASTAVSTNGSVILQAADGTSAGCNNGAQLCATQGGTLTVGPDSDIELLPELSDTSTAVVAQAQIQSSVQLTGQQVNIQGGQINAPGGTLAVIAAANPNAGLVTDGNTAAQINIAAGTSINLAGSDAELPASANLLTIQLLANQLEDDPQQRTGALHGTTVIVDTRDGKPPIISDPAWQAALQGIEENVAQRTSVGGSASFLSEGDIVVNSGATINVSGGQWNYAPGVIQTSKLIGANGQAYNISTANPALPYTGVLNPTYKQTFNGFGIQSVEPTPGLGQSESGYVQGFSAGTVQFAAPAMVMQGTLIGTAVNGPYQRSAATIPAESSPGLAIAAGGTLIIGDPLLGTNAAGLPDFFAPAVNFTTQVPPITIAPGTSLVSQPLQLPVSYITSGGFAQTQIYSDSTVTLPAGLPLNLGAGGSLLVDAPRINIDSNIQALGGSIELYTAQTALYSGSGLPRIGIDIADAVTLDVRGQWTNDSADAPASPLTATYQNGGTIVLSLESSASPAGSLAPGPLSPNTAGGELVLGNDVSLLASGGAWNQFGNKLVGGQGGSVTLDASPYQSALQVGSGDTLQAFGVKGAAGGVFSLSAPSIAVGSGSTWAGAQRSDPLTTPGQSFDLGAALFSQDGFSGVSLTATGPGSTGAASNDVLTITAGTAITAQAQTLQLSPGYMTRPTGGVISDFSAPTLLPEVDRTPYTIKFNEAPSVTIPDTFTTIGDLDIAQGASIVADPNSTISMIGQGSVLIDGVLRAPGGTISAQITQPFGLTNSDPGFLPDQRIELGSQAVLDVSGTTVLTPNSMGLSLGNVLPGGNVSLLAFRGEVVTDPGSFIDIGGASALLDVQKIGGTGGYSAATIGSAGGSLLVQSVDSVSLLGNLSAAAGASSAGSIQSGSLEVDLSNSFFSSVNPLTNLPPTTPLTIELVSTTAGASPSASYGNLAVLGITQLEQSGIDALKLQADGSIEIDSGLPLSMGREISLNAPQITVGAGTTASLNAPYVQLTDSLSAATSLPTAVPGNAMLNVSAQEIVLSGFTALQGVQNVTLNSSGDVQFEPLANQLAGGMALAGNLTINAARVYPATNAAYAIDDTGSTSTVTIGQTNASPGAPLSVNGSLTIDATNITSSGTILAPFGSIALNATNSLSLLNTSLTSVSAGGALLPYGQTQLNEQEWVYGSNNTTQVTGIPTRQISLNGSQVSLASGATVDVSGGGDLSAYEWVPGTGGSVDSLGQASSAATKLYAVLPSTLGQYAAYDLQEFSGSSVTPGESVYLSGVAGLASGVYPLLPARYGLLPGAYLIQVEPGYQSLQPGTLGVLPSGAPVVAGYLSFGNTGLQSAAGYTGFAVYPGSYSQSLAQYQISTGSSFFSAAAASAGQTQVTLPADAGTLLISAGNSLSALGKVNSSAGSGGTAATIDISATDLTVTATSAPSNSAGVTIGAPVIQSWNAGDLILGGQLQQSADGTSVDVTASTVTIGTNAQISAGQILAVAGQSIDVQAGATVESRSGASGTALKALPASTVLNLVGSNASGAALLAVSDMSLPIAVRTPNSGQSSGGPGATIDVASGATLSTRGAVALDAPAQVTIDGAVNAPGASWSLASNSIAFVGNAGASADTLQVTPALLSQMQTAGAIRLSSAGAIDLLTPVSLGASSVSATPSLSALTLSATSINLNGNPASLGAQTLSLEGVGGSAVAPTAGTATLTLVANELDIGAGVNAGYLTINGAAQTNAQVAGAVVGQGNGTLAISGNVSLAAAELTALGQSVALPGQSIPTGTTVQSATNIAVPNGSLQILQNGTAVTPGSLTASLGGNLALSANQIQDSGSIIVPGGQISLQSSGDLVAGSSAVINAGGITVSAVGETVGAQGGIVNLNAGGNLTLPTGAGTGRFLDAHRWRHGNLGCESLGQCCSGCDRRQLHAGCGDIGR
jgi:filamentous hemagglutinin